MQQPNYFTKLGTFVNGKSRKQALTALRKPGAWNTSSWLVVRRLLAWIIGEDSDDDSQEPPGNNGADHERHRVHGKFLPIYTGGGIALPFSIVHGYEGHAGFYLDPIKSGLPLLDARFCNTLNTAWRVCQHAALERGQTWATTLRMDTQIDPLHLLEDESAGGMFTIGMIVATKGDPLDEDASASFTIKPSSRTGPTDPLGPDDIQLGHVGHADKKVHGAMKAGLQRLYFYTAQPGIPKNQQIKTPEIDSLRTAIQEMTRDAAKEKVLLAFAMEAAKRWQNGDKPGPEQPERFIEPHYALLRNEPDSKDHAHRLAKMHLSPEETIHGNRLEPLLTDERRNSITLAPDNQKSVGDDELFRLLNTALEEATARPLPESVLRIRDESAAGR